MHDGAVFAFVHGTNPEGLLLIDATGNSLGSAGWEYALLRSADAELHIELDGREVWTCDRAVHTADDLRKPYCVILSALEPDTRPLPARGCRIIGEAPKRLEQNMESVFRMLTIGIAAISLSLAAGLGVIGFFGLPLLIGGLLWIGTERLCGRLRRRRR